MTIAVPSVSDRHLLNRFSFGVRPGLVSQAVSKGGAKKWFAWQLYPGNVPDLPGTTVDSWYPHIGQTPAKIWRDHTTHVFSSLEWSVEFQNWTLMRRILSQRQVLEVMTDFWSNLLYIPAFDFDTWPLRKQYDATIRKYALGRFADLLVAAVTHPAMSCYLDTTLSSASHLNENLGREVLELHTVGVAAGYTEAMVQDSARILTGYHVDKFNTWVGSYVTTDHSTGPVSVLGFQHANAAADGRPVAEAYIRYLATHPDTINRVARRLCTHLVSDNPTDALVSAVAKSLADSGTDIRTALRTLTAHPDFATGVDQKVRSPDQDAVASWRVMQVEPQDPGSDLTAFGHEVREKSAAMGLVPFDWPRPDGPPLVNEAWSGAGRILATWRTHQVLAWGSPASRVTYRPALDWLPPAPATLDQITDHVARQIHARATDSNLLLAAQKMFGLAGTYKFAAQADFKEWRVSALITLLLNTHQHMSR